MRLLLALVALVALSWGTGAGNYLLDSVKASAAANRAAYEKEQRPAFYSTDGQCTVFRFRGGDNDWIYFTRCGKDVTTQGPERCHYSGKTRICEAGSQVATIEE